MNRVITISREYGSGGSELGQRLSAVMGIPCYDRQIISEISRETGLSQQTVRSLSEQQSNPLPRARSLSLNYREPLEMCILREQTDFIRRTAEEGSCIIVGRCADFLIEKSFNIMVYASMEYRVERCQKHCEALSDEEIKKDLIRIDRERARYYQQNTGRKWGDKQNYHVCVNTSMTDMEALVPPLVALIEASFK